VSATGIGPDATAEQARRRRWRLLLGEAAEEPLGAGLTAGEQGMDEALGALYEEAGEVEDRPGGQRYGALGSSAPSVARWLGDIRSYFPTSVVQVMQRDAIDRLGLTSMLLEPELLDSVQPDVHLAATLVSLNRVMPETAKRTARLVVGQGGRRDRAPDHQHHPGGGARSRSAGPAGPGGRGSATSTGTPPSGATSTTTCRSAAR
jgi:hypothetical protein